MAEFTMEKGADGVAVITWDLPGRSMNVLTQQGIDGAVLQMFNHGTSSAALFLIVGVIYDRAHHRDLNGFGGMSQQMPVYWGLTTIGFFAALGLPGMAGFISEAMTLVGAYSSANPDFRVLVVISVLGIVITAAFLLWAMQRVFLGTLNEKYASFPDIDKREMELAARSKRLDAAHAAKLADLDQKLKLVAQLSSKRMADKGIFAPEGAAA